MRPGSVPPWPGSSTTVRPLRLCPDAADPLPLAQHGGASRRRRERLQVAKARSVSGPTEPSPGEAVGALEAAHRLLGVRAEQAVHPARGEAEGVEPLLQG